MDREAYQEKLNEVAQAVVDLCAEEIRSRGLRSIVSTEQNLKADKWVDWGQSDRSGTYQVTLQREWSTAKIQDYGLDELIHRSLRSWGVELGYKLARPYDMTTFEMENPKGVVACNVRDSKNTIALRAVMDYSIHTDSMLVRFDVLVKWNDQ